MEQKRYCRILKRGVHSGVFYEAGEIYLVDRICDGNKAAWLINKEGKKFIVSLHNHPIHGKEGELIDFEDPYNQQQNIEIW